jgi:hypothetical protein
MHIDDTNSNSDLALEYKAWNWMRQR